MTHYLGILDGSGSTWGVRVPDLPGVYGGGETPEAAISDAISAAREWAAQVVSGGMEIPAARPVQDVLPEVESGEVTVMIPLLLDAGRTVKANVTFDAGLLEAIDAEAKQRGLTRSAFLASAASEKIQARR